MCGEMEGRREGSKGRAYGQHVAAYNCCFVGGGEERVFGDTDVDGFKAALVERDVFGDETAEAVDYGGVGDGLGGVGVGWFFD